MTKRVAINKPRTQAPHTGAPCHLSEIRGNASPTAPARRTGRGLMDGLMNHIQPIPGGPNRPHQGIYDTAPRPAS